MNLNESEKRIGERLLTYVSRHYFMGKQLLRCETEMKAIADKARRTMSISVKSYPKVVLHLNVGKPSVPSIKV